MIAQLLTTRRAGAHHRAAGQLQIGTLVVRVARHEEELLLEADHRAHATDLHAKVLEEAGAGAGHGLHRAQQRRLLIESLAAK